MKYFILKDVSKRTHKIIDYSNHYPNSLAFQKEGYPEKNHVLSMTNHKYFTSYQHHYLENLISLTLIGVS